jgi:hypothetical protein
MQLLMQWRVAAVKLQKECNQTFSKGRHFKQEKAKMQHIDTPNVLIVFMLYIINVTYTTVQLLKL